MRINNNLMAMNTHRQLGISNGSGAKSIEKLSSGYRINRAGDDAAGLAISEKMRAQIRGLNQASRNSQDAISLIQTAEGAMNETHAILQRMRELAVQSSNDTNVKIDREQIQKEMNQLTTEINRIGNTTEFNTMKLLNGEKANGVLKEGATGSVALNAGKVDVNGSITGYTVDGTGADKIKKAIGSLKIEAGAFATSADAAGAASQQITITRTTSGFTVTMDSNMTSTTSFSTTDTLNADANGNFVYNAHGVSFTISKEQAEGISSTSTMNLKVSTAVGSVVSDFALESPWGTTGTTPTAKATMTGGLTVTQSADNADVRSVEIKATTAGYTVDLKNSAGVSVQSENFSSVATTLSYDNHGVKFDLKLDKAITAGSTMSASISLTGLGTTKSYASTDYDNNAVKFQVGANQNQFMDLSISDVRSKALQVSSDAAGSASITIGTAQVTASFVSVASVSDGVSSTLSEYALDVSTHEKAAAAITVVNNAIEKISSERSNMGAVQNRLEHTIKNLDTSSENLQASESRIRDVDMAKEMMEFTKNNILQQAAQAMLAQANQAPQGVLQLLR